MFRTNKGLTAVLAMALAAVFGSSAFAAPIGYNFSETGGRSNPGAGNINSFSASYNDVVRPSLQVSFDISRNTTTSALANSAWLVLSPGGDPRASAGGELAILYFDFERRNIYAYRYEETRGASFGRRSWKNPDNHIATFSRALKVRRTEREGGVANRLQVSFDLDTSVIQNFSDDPNWYGSSFGEEIGVWFRTAEATTFETSGGLISDFVTAREGALDRTGRTTTPFRVSEPAGLAAIGFSAILGLALFRRRKSVQAA